MTPKVSVIIPCYNAVDTLAGAVASIPRGGTEVIVVDDGSTDGSTGVVRGLYEIGAVHKAIYHDENQGVASAINDGLGVAEGEYVVFLGADDDFTTDFWYAYEQLDGTDLVYFDLVINSGDVWRVTPETKEQLCGSVKFMRREFIGDTREPEEKKAGEDYYFYQALLAKNPTEKFTGIVAKHYNFPREGSLTNRRLKGEFKDEEI